MISYIYKDRLHRLMQNDNIYKVTKTYKDTIRTNYIELRQIEHA